MIYLDPWYEGNYDDEEPVGDDGYHAWQAREDNRALADEIDARAERKYGSF